MASRPGNCADPLKRCMPWKMGCRLTCFVVHQEFEKNFWMFVELGGASND
jgi:hypothetical protein